MRILVTGANGYIGRNFFANWHSEESVEWVLCDLKMKQNLVSTSPISFVEGDLADSLFCQSLIEEYAPDVIVHLAGIPSLQESKQSNVEVFSANVLPTQWLLSALQFEEHPCHFIFASTGIIYGDQAKPMGESSPVNPKNNYGLSKLLGEVAINYFQKSSPQHAFTIIRPSVVYGEDQKGDMFIPSLVNSIKAKKPFAMTKGEQYRDFIHVKDLCDAIQALIQKRMTGTYNVSSGEKIQLREVAEFVAKVSGRPELLELGKIPYRKNEVWNYALNNAKLQADTNWRPSRDLLNELKKLLQD